jgi:MFS family permease
MLIPKIHNKGVFFIAVSQFGMAFSFHCILSFMPFCIMQNSPYGQKETLIWIGLILGAANIVATFVAPFWGGLTSRFSPKRLFEQGMLLNGILNLFMGFTGNLYLLLLFRILQGVLGGVSTIGLVLISAKSPQDRLPKDLSLFQSAITAGQLIGPLAGAYVASIFGYRAPFILAFLVVAVFLTFCHFHVIDIPLQKKAPRSETPFKKSIFFGWSVAFIGTLNLAFLPSILPNILQGFQVIGNAALRSAGFIIMSYMITAIIGNFLLSRLSIKIGVIKVIALACISAALLQILLILSQGVLSFMVIRMAQTAFIAAVIPLTFSIFTRDAGGGRIGFLNSSRFAGAAVGPIMATSVLAYTNLLTLYILIAGLTLISLWAFLKSNK